MKKVFLFLTICLLVVSCEKDEAVDLTNLNQENYFNLKDLERSPSFSKPLNKPNEVRDFIITKSDGTNLNFHLKADESTIAGKKRTMWGRVTINGRTEDAALLVGENGFYLTYSDNGDKFAIKSKEKLDIGLPDTSILVEKIKQNKDVVAKMNKQGVDVDKLLKPSIDDDATHDIVVESGSNYSLINKTATQEKRSKASGSKSICGEVDSSKDHYLLDRSKIEKSSGDILRYTLRVVYMESSYDIISAVLDLGLSLKAVDERIEIYVRFPELLDDLNLQIVNATSVEERGRKSAAMMDYLFAMRKENNSNDQLQNLISYMEDIKDNHEFTQPVYDLLFNSGRSAYAALYENSWEHSVGRALVDKYKNSSSVSPFVVSLSSLVACDDSDTTLAHECGHNLGAVHSPYIFGLMYGSATIFKKNKHLLESNITKIKTNFGL